MGRRAKQTNKNNNPLFTKNKPHMLMVEGEEGNLEVVEGKVCTSRLRICCFFRARRLEGGWRTDPRMPAKEE